MKNKTHSKLAALWCWLSRLVLLGLVVSLTACEVRITSTQECVEGEPHDWGKWEITSKPDNYFDHVEVQRRTCQRCGYSERESSHPK